MPYITTITTDGVTPLSKWLTACRVVVDDITDGASSFEDRVLCGLAIEVSSDDNIPWSECITQTAIWCNAMGNDYQPLMTVDQLLRMATICDDDTQPATAWLLSVWPLVVAMACQPENQSPAPHDLRLHQNRYISYAASSHSHYAAAVFSKCIAETVLTMWRHGTIANPSQDVIDKCQLVHGYADIYVRIPLPDPTSHYFPSISHWLNYNGNISITSMSLDSTDEDTTAWIDSVPSTHWQRIIPIDVVWPEWLQRATHAGKMAAYRYHQKYGIWPRHTIHEEL